MSDTLGVNTNTAIKVLAVGALFCGAVVVAGLILVARMLRDG